MSGKRRQTNNRRKPAREIETSLGVVKVEMSSGNDQIEEHVEREQKGILRWGKNNNYPQYLLALYYDNALHSGIVNHKKFYLTSGGFEVTGPDAIAAEEFLNNKRSDLSFMDCLDQNVFDQQIFRGIAIRGVWARDGERISFFEPIDFDTVRWSPENKCFAISEDWTVTNQTPEKTGFRWIKPFDKRRPRGEFILYFKSPVRSKNSKLEEGFYPKPGYSGGIAAITTDTEIDSYHLNEIVNGFKTGTIISLNGGKPPTEEQEKKIAKEIKEGATAKGKAGNVLVVFSKGRDQAPEVISLNGNDLDKRYLNLETATQQKILTSHSVTVPGLFGIKTSGQLGGQAELEAGFQIMVNTTIRSDQRWLEEIYNHLLTLAGFSSEITLLPPRPLFEKEETGEAEATLKAVDSLGEEFGAKYLERMEDKTLQKLASLPARPGSDLVARELSRRYAAKFEREDPILKALRNCGRSREGIKVLFGQELPHEVSSSWLTMKETGLKVKQGFQIDLTDDELNVLQQIIDGVPPDEVEGFDPERRREIIESLVEQEILNEEGVPTDIAEQAIIDSIFEIFYEYVERADAPPLVPGGESRPFCLELLRLSETTVWTREEIEIISAAVNRDVWRERGGWYHNPRTERNTPFCRHIWKQVIVQTQQT